MQSDSKKIDVFQITLGTNNYEMWKRCELLYKVAFDTIEVKSGRGKNSKIIKDFKHKIPKENRERIANSCEYYKKLYEEDMKKKEVGSLEVIKYRFELIDDEPKIIIDMIKVLDKNGAHIKFAKLKGVLDYLSKYPIKFKQL